jgi:NAD(P)-dependent dehydrogenase (short-subunit alcohol dehydrogenase family)
MVKKAIAKFGQIDVLINNAGVLFLGTLAETEEVIWDNVIDVNLKSCYLCSRAVAPGMIARKQGNIINVSSIAGFKAWPGQLVYGVSKAGVAMLTRELARELGPYGIRVNAIAPGTTYTRMNEPQSNDPEFTRRRLPNVPLGRLGEPEDMVGAALFLASDAANWITGQTIAIDGGYLA